MIRNAVIEGLNSRARLPNAIVIITGDQFLTTDPLFLPSELEKKVRWVLRELSAAIDTRKSLLKPKCFIFGEPRIMWVRMFQCTAGDPVSQENINKFNNLLYRVCCGKAVYTPELKLFTNSSARCYDKRGKRIDESFKELWIAMSNEIKRFDQRDEHYFINKKVEERIKELRQEDELRFERKASTYLAVTGASSFTDDARRRNSSHRSDQRDHNVYSSSKYDSRERSHSADRRRQHHDRSHHRR